MAVTGDGGMGAEPDAQQSFHARARRYCELLEALGRDEPTDARQLASALGELYAAATQLPHRSPADVATEPAAPPDSTAVRHALQAVFGELDRYWTVFDPGHRDEPVEASLADDLADVYSDVKQGLMVLDETGDMDEATWHWRDSFWSHWGRHATEALRAMHNRTQESG
jgi:hypothetical protein